MFNFGALGCGVKSVSPKIKHCKLKRLEKHQRDFRVACFPVVTAVEDLCRKVEHWIQLSDSNMLQDFLFRLSTQVNRGMGLQ